jgi:hypothetical protein
LPASSATNTEWEVAGEVVVTVAWLTDTICTPDDDVGAERIAGTESTIGGACWTCVFASGGVIGDLGAGNGGRSGEEESSVPHFEFVLYSRSSIQEVVDRVGG